MADIIYNRFTANIANKLINLDTDDIRCALVLSSYTPDKDHNTWSQVSAYEVLNGNGYFTNGSQLLNTTVTQDDTNDLSVFSADDVTWANSTITARYTVLYDNTLPGKDLIACFDFGLDKMSGNGDFKIQWNPIGVFTFGQQ